jgi:hypothetical protein
MLKESLNAKRLKQVFLLRSDSDALPAPPEAAPTNRSLSSKGCHAPREHITNCPFCKKAAVNPKPDIGQWKLRCMTPGCCKAAATIWSDKYGIIFQRNCCLNCKNSKRLNTRCDCTQPKVDENAPDTATRRMDIILANVLPPHKCHHDNCNIVCHYSCLIKWVLHQHKSGTPNATCVVCKRPIAAEFQKFARANSVEEAFSSN